MARPERTGEVTGFDVALAGGGDEHVRLVQAWARSVVWLDWAPWHAAVVEVAERHLPDLARR